MIYIQSYQGIPMWDFGSSALHACRDWNKSYRLVENTNVIPETAQCLIGSVEWCQEYLKRIGVKVLAIDLLLFQEFLGRKVYYQNSKEFENQEHKYPIFIKPKDQIKAFTGTQLTSKFDIELVLSGFEGELCVQSVMDFQSEWRVYINRRRVIGCKQYKGEHLLFPEKDVISDCVEYALSQLDLISFTLDFGVDKLGRTYLIEPNDGWAIGNYGLESLDYLNFCVDRWKQITKTQNI